MNNRFFLLILLALFCMKPLQAQKCTPTATFTYTRLNSEGVAEQVEEELESYSGSAPVKGVFHANPSDVGSYAVRYEWTIFEAGRQSTPIVHRFEEDIEYTFSESGTFYVQLKATFVLGTDTIAYPEEGEESYISVEVLTSILEMPNGFSPNGDDFNEVYKAKANHQSIVSFKATVFNRWGKRLYSWNDVNGGWDGKVNGRTVPDGVYFVNVVAKGADGHEYRIRKDINVLTHKNETGKSDTETP